MTVLACAGELCNVQPDTFLIDSPWLSEAKAANVCICNMHKAATLDIGAYEADSVQFEVDANILTSWAFEQEPLQRPASLAEPAEAEKFC